MTAAPAVAVIGVDAAASGTLLDLLERGDVLETGAAFLLMLEVMCARAEQVGDPGGTQERVRSAIARVRSALDDLSGRAEEDLSDRLAPGFVVGW